MSHVNKIKPQSRSAIVSNILQTIEDDKNNGTSLADDMILNVCLADGMVINFSLSSSQQPEEQQMAELIALDCDIGFIEAIPMPKVRVMMFKDILRMVDSQLRGILADPKQALCEKFDLDATYCDNATGGFFMLTVSEDDRKLIDYMRGDKVTGINIVAYSQNNQLPVAFAGKELSVAQFEDMLAGDEVTLLF